MRLDHNFECAPAHLRPLRVSCATTPRPSTPLPDGSGSITTGVIGNTLTRADSVAAEHSWTLSPNHGEPAPIRLHAPRLRSDFAAHRPARVAGLADSQHSGFRLFATCCRPTTSSASSNSGPPANGNAEFTTSVTQFVTTSPGCAAATA